MSFFRELKRRNVFRVVAAYLVAGWLLIEVSETLEGTLHLPDWAVIVLFANSGSQIRGQTPNSIGARLQI